MKKSFGAKTLIYPTPVWVDSHRILKYIIWGVIIGGVITAGYFLPNLKLAGAIKY